MYYVNEEQIDARLRFLPVVTEALRRLDTGSHPEPVDVLTAFAQERALHLAIEIVTDVGSLLIDGFMMRDASSYEDIVDVLKTEGVLTDSIAEQIKVLVGLRRPLTQQYMEIDRSSLRRDMAEIADALDPFPTLVAAFVRKELQPFK
jgi:uncharacterized protein YutE (UPF0331/DUF86 family)